MFGSMPSCSFPPPKAGAKKLSYNSLNLAYSGQHPCFGPNWFIQFCHTWRWIRYAGMPRKSLPRKQAKVDTGHQCFSVVAQARAKILPRLPQGSFQMKELDRTTIYSYCRDEWEMRSSCRGDSLLPFGTWWDMTGSVALSCQQSSHECSEVFLFAPANYSSASSCLGSVPTLFRQSHRSSSVWLWTRSIASGNCCSTGFVLVCKGIGSVT